MSYKYNTAKYVELKEGVALKYISRKEALRLTKKIFFKGLNKFNRYLKKHHLYDHYDTLNSYDYPLVTWEKMKIKSCGLTIRNSKGNYTIKLNICFLYSSDAYEFLKSTLLHELAHYICGVLFDDFNHNDLFKTICNIIGDSGETFGHYKIPEIFRHYT